MAASVSPKEGEAFENELIERTTFRIASCRTDEEFEESLQKCLCLVVSKLSTKYESVRTKILELLVHVNKRVKSRPKIQLPVAQLLLTYQDPSANAFVNNFTIIYLKIGFPRLKVAEQLQLLPMILGSLEGKPANQQDSLLLLMLPLIPHVKIPTTKEGCKNLFNFAEKTYVAKFFRDFAYDVLLMPYGIAKPDASAAVTVPPGMSEYAVKRILSSEEPLSAEQFEQIKCAMVKVLSCGVYAPTEVAIHLVVASADSRHSVASVGDNELRRLNSDIDWSSIELLQRLYDLFLGTVVPKDQSRCTVRPEHRRTAANTRMRLKIIPLLIKSPTSANLLIPAIQTIFEALNGADTKTNLRIKGLSLVIHFSTHCTSDSFSAVAPLLLNEMKKLALQSPLDDVEDRNSVVVIRNMSLTAIPKILKKCPTLLAQNLSLITSLLDIMKSEEASRNAEFKSSIKSALLDMMHVVKGSGKSEEQLTVLESILLAYFQDDWVEIREVICKYAVFLFPAKHVPSKFVLLMASADLHPEVRKVALDYLDSEANELPLFSEIMPYIKNRLKTTRRLTVTSEMIFYVRRCLSSQLETEGGEGGSDFQLFAGFVESAYSQKEQNSTIWDSVILYIEWIKDAVLSKQTRNPKVSSAKDTTFYFLEIVTALPQQALKLVVTNPERVVSDVYKVALMEADEPQDSLCQVIALVVRSCYPSDACVKYVNERFEEASKEKTGISEKVVSSRVALYVLVDSKPKNEENLRKMVALGTSWISTKSADVLLKITGCKIIGEVAKCMDVTKIAPSEIKSQLADCISSQSLHMAEAATLSLAFLGVGRTFEPNFHRECLELLLTKGSDIIEVPFHFTLGDSICCLLMQSPLQHLRISKTHKKKMSEVTEWQYEETERIIGLILEKYMSHPKRSVRTSSCIWILCLLKNCGTFVRNCGNMLEIQQRLLRLLGEKQPKTDEKKTSIQLSDVLEDITPKCLKLLHDNASESQQAELRKDLNIIFSLTDQETGDYSSGSSSIVAMKEIFILVNECTGDTKLFYEFLDVISFRLWGSGTKAKEFFQSKSFEASFKEKVEPYKLQLIPKLFVGINDPSATTRNYLTSIWITLFGGTSKTKIVTEHLHIILAQISSNLEDSFWKLRQSACVALSEIFTLGANGLKDNLDLLVPLYERCFKVVDDMKETVRIKAELTLKSLFRITVELCDSSLVGETTSRKALSALLPILIQTGLSSPAEVVRKSSLKTLISIAESSSSSMKPHLHILVPSLLEALSAFESQTVNYLSVRLEGEEELHEKLDTLRVTNIHSSPVFNALKQSIPHIDNDVMEQLTPHLSEAIDSSVGLCTKVGACLFLVQLVDKRADVIRPYSEKLLRSLLKNISNRNLTIQKTCADTVGHVMKLIPDATVETLITNYRDQYLTDDSQKSRQVIATLMSSLGKRCPDVVRKHASLVLPLTFYAMHEAKTVEGETSTEKSASTPAAAFEELWLEFAPTTEGGLKLYLKEIVEYICKGFDSRLWVVKQQAAKCLMALVNKIQGPFEIDLVLKLTDMLSSNLAGRTWDGKENVLNALQAIVCKHRESLLELSKKGQFDISKVTELCLKECQREKLSYKNWAIKSTVKIICTLDVQKFSVFYNEIVKPTILSCTKTKDESENEHQKEELSLLRCSIDAIRTFFSEDHIVETGVRVDCVELLVQTYPIVTYKVKTETVAALLAVVKSTKASEKEHAALLFEKCANLIEELLNTTRYSDLQLLGLELTETFINLIEQISQKERIVQGIQMISTESSSPALREKADALAITLRLV